MTITYSSEQILISRQECEAMQAELEQLRAELKRLRADEQRNHDEMNESIQVSVRLADEVASLQSAVHLIDATLKERNAEVAWLREALEMYANPKNWMDCEYGCKCIFKLEKNGMQIARRGLDGEA